ncbi:hypothetical protein LOTGIDRAFT_155518 [Lottia gigantea]|uniref:Trans-golgi network protein 2 n=1 Tax=Lottia gigantea TaxID=225164 RepID=V3Z0Z1_LOTGI|nr:hypothetical protein LOTGIDRAFT_155518 [Lottia gigantea]ESO84193.1 hypothetical protein LOTGIDRAFT_155518 [Lottia gigantea]
MKKLQIIFLLCVTGVSFISALKNATDGVQELTKDHSTKVMKDSAFNSTNIMDNPINVTKASTGGKDGGNKTVTNSWHITTDRGDDPNRGATKNNSTVVPKVPTGNSSNGDGERPTDPNRGATKNNSTVVPIVPTVKTDSEYGKYPTDPNMGATKVNSTVVPKVPTGDPDYEDGEHPTDPNGGATKNNSTVVPIVPTVKTGSEYGEHPTDPNRGATKVNSTVVLKVPTGNSSNGDGERPTDPNRGATKNNSTVVPIVPTVKTGSEYGEHPTDPNRGATKVNSTVVPKVPTVKTPVQQTTVTRGGKSGTNDNDQESPQPQENGINLSKEKDYTPEADSPSSGHFMGYLLTAIILCVAGYVVFHNKQKIIAFIVEGRSGRQRRRTGNGVEYKKLHSNVEEVMPSLDQSAASKHFIY